MLRTQVYLPQELYSQLVTLARAADLPVAEVIRNALQSGIKTVAKKQNDLALLAKLKIKGGPKDLSAKMDKYLYGK